MSDIQRLIRREVDSRDPIRIVTVIGDRRMKNMSPLDTAPVWVTDVEFGESKPMRNIPIKSINGSMFYAERGQSVQVRKSTLGRWQIIGPGDRITAFKVTKTYDLTAQTVETTTTSGFTFQDVPAEFYQGAQSMQRGELPPGAANVDFTTTTITRLDSGSFIADGLNDGDSLQIGGSVIATNNKTATVTTVAALVLTFPAATFTASTGELGVGLGVVGTSRWTDSATGFPFSELIDSDGNPV